VLLIAQGSSSLTDAKTFSFEGDSPTPLWNFQPMPLTINGLAPDEFGNIEVPLGGGGDNPFVIENGLLCISVEEG
jgi:hypothetical protein